MAENLSHIALRLTHRRGAAVLYVWLVHRVFGIAYLRVGLVDSKGENTNPGHPGLTRVLVIPEPRRRQRASRLCRLIRRGR